MLLYKKLLLMTFGTTLVFCGLKLFSSIVTRVTRLELGDLETWSLFQEGTINSFISACRSDWLWGPSGLIQCVQGLESLEH